MTSPRGSSIVVVLVLVLVLVVAATRSTSSFATNAFVVRFPTIVRRGRIVRSRRAPVRATEGDGDGDDARDKLVPLFDRARATTTTPKEAENAENAHDPFRYEWGTWVDDDSVVALMARVDEVRAAPGAYDALRSLLDVDDETTSTSTSTSVRVASGPRWDVLLHALPKDAAYAHRWPTGSWSVVKALTGVVEVAMLKENHRDDTTTKRTKKNLRGGSDGKSGVGGGAAIPGEDCVKYVGGPLRSYEGKSNKNVLVEVVVRPPVGVETENVAALPEWDAERLEDVLDVVVLPEAEDEDEDDDDDDDEDDAPRVTAQEQSQQLGRKLGMTFDAVGGLDDQLDTIVRRVLASRANPAAARRLGVSHVRGVLLSGPPGCGKTLLARELARLLGAREPRIVNGPEILDKFIGEAERRVRDLFAPAEAEYAAVGDDSALHVIVLDEMDAIGRRRGDASSDTTGVRDSVVNQLLAKMDGVREANNVLVVGLTNRPELLDPALLRPGRLEVQLRVELPDAAGRRDVLRIHTRRMREEGGLTTDAEDLVENMADDGLAARTDKFTGAELAGLVRSAASFALARSVASADFDLDGAKETTSLETNDDDDDDEGRVDVDDFERALREVRPALGKQDDLLRTRFPRGVVPCSTATERAMRDLRRFTAPVVVVGRDGDDASSPPPPRTESLLLVGAGAGAGVTALAAWAAAGTSRRDDVDRARLVTALDLLTAGGGDEGSRAGALADVFSEARASPRSLLVLDDVDQLCAGSGPGGYSSVMIAALRASLRTPPESSTTAKAGGQAAARDGRGRFLRVLATTSRSDAACRTLHDLFDETIVVPLLTETNDVERLLAETGHGENARPMASLLSRFIADGGGAGMGVKTILRLTDRATAAAAFSRRGSDDDDDHDHNVPEITLREVESAILLQALGDILEDYRGDETAASLMCEVL